MEFFLDSIVNKLQHLPQSRWQEVLNFVEFLTWQEVHSHQLDSPESISGISNQEFEYLADQLTDEFNQSFGADIPTVSDYAVSRAGIYEEHP